MDLPTLERVTVARSRADLVLDERVRPLGGGTWLYSERQDDLRGLVDLTALDWTPWQPRADGGIGIAATCTIRDLTQIPERSGWRALPLFAQCASSLLASFKVQGTATVGGNIATALAAGAMISLTAALDGTLLLWGAADAERLEPVERFVLEQRRTTLRPDEVIRSIEIPGRAMAARTAFRRIALSPLGRAGTVVVGRRDDDGATVLSVTGGTVRPEVLRFAAPPSPADVAAAVAGIRTWFTDPHGAADWRRAMTALLAEQVRDELERAG